MKIAGTFGKNIQYQIASAITTLEAITPQKYQRLAVQQTSFWIVVLQKLWRINVKHSHKSLSTFLQGGLNPSQDLLANHWIVPPKSLNITTTETVETIVHVFVSPKSTPSVKALSKLSCQYLASEENPTPDPREASDVVAGCGWRTLEKQLLMHIWAHI